MLGVSLQKSTAFGVYGFVKCVACNAACVAMPCCTHSRDVPTSSPAAGLSQDITPRP